MQIFGCGEFDRKRGREAWLLMQLSKLPLKRLSVFRRYRLDEIVPILDDLGNLR